jgi:hypothetical protein
MPSSSLILLTLHATKKLTHQFGGAENQQKYNEVNEK